jgi:hypothetical protein
MKQLLLNNSIDAIIKSQETYLRRNWPETGSFQLLIVLGHQQELGWSID